MERQGIKWLSATHKEKISELQELKALTQKAIQRYKAILSRFILTNDQKQNI